MPKLIGLTGNMGCGKTTVAALLAGYPGVRVVSADAVAKRAVFDPSNASAVRAILGIAPETPLERTAVRSAVFTCADKRRAIGSFAGKFVWRAVSEARAASGPDGLVIVEHALIFEQKSEARFDAIVAVTCPAELQRARLAARPGTLQDDIDTRLALQLPQAVKARRAQYHIHNDGSTETLATRVAELYRALTERNVS